MFEPDDEIIRNGDEGTCLYFLEKGIINIYLDDE